MPAFEHFPMTKDTKVWLSDWTRSHVLSEARSLSELDDMIAECIDNSATEGMSEDDLREASGGDLRAYLSEAVLRSASG
jgi:hypothetical protein